jgi:hypothetical protein
VHVLCAAAWEITVSYLWSRDNISWFLFLYMFYAFGWLLMVVFLLQYHIQLITQNLTTNEHINMNKYAYMRNQYNLTDNPFDLKSAQRNFMDGMFPLSKQLYTRADALQLRNSRSDYLGPRSQAANSNSPGANAGKNEDDAIAPLLDKAAALV